MDEITKKLMPYLYWAAVFAVVPLLVSILSWVIKAWWNSPKKKGDRGEKRVADLLSLRLPDEYKVLNDIYLLKENGDTAQIDHIVVSPYGVFVIETKNYSGWIYIARGTWIENNYGKKTPFKVNPVEQNRGHIQALVRALGISPSYFHSVVAFAGGCELKMEPRPEGVVYADKVTSYICSFGQRVIGADQVDEIVSRIVELDAEVGDERKANHVANLRKRHSRHS